MSDPPNPTSSAGEILKARRQEQNLSVSDVAAQLNLDPRVIAAIEADDQTALPAALYVRGYLRGYAKILKIDADDIIARYSAGCREEPPQIVPETRHPSQTSSTDKPVLVITYLVSFTLVILLFAWWQSTFVLAPPEGTGKQAVAELPPPRLPYEYRIVHHPRSTGYRAEDLEESAPVAAAGGDGEEAAGSEATPAADSDNLAAGETGPDTVIFRLRAESWIEVSDGSERRLFIGIAPQGRTLTVRGTQPFKVVLGFADGVDVEFNGENFNTALYSHNGVARFILPPE